MIQIVVEHISDKTNLVDHTIGYLFEMAIIQRVYVNIYTKLYYI